MGKQTTRYITQPKPYPDEFDVLDWEEDSFPRISNVASSCECTGIMPRPPENEEEDEAYRSLFSNELPKE